MANMIRRSLKKKKSSTNSASAAATDTTGAISTAAEGMTSDQNNQVLSDGEGKKSEAVAAPMFKKRGRNM